MMRTQSTAGADFEAWLDDNFDVYREIVRLTRTYVTTTGSAKVGIDLPVSQIRWDRNIATRSDTFKVNNNHLPFLARLIMFCEPDLKGVFEVRRSDEADAWLADWLR